MHEKHGSVALQLMDDHLGNTAAIAGAEAADYHTTASARTRAPTTPPERFLESPGELCACENPFPSRDPDLLSRGNKFCKVSSSTCYEYSFLEGHSHKDYQIKLHAPLVR